MKNFEIFEKENEKFYILYIIKSILLTNQKGLIFIKPQNKLVKTVYNIFIAYAKIIDINILVNHKLILVINFF